MCEDHRVEAEEIEDLTKLEYVLSMALCSYFRVIGLAC